MSSNTDTKLIRMANQIAAFFESQPAGGRRTAIADHLRDFWDPRMRRRLFEMMDAGEADGLSPIARDGAEELRDGEPQGEGYPITDGRIESEPAVGKDS